MTFLAWLKQYWIPKSTMWWPGFAMFLSALVMASAEGFPVMQPFAAILTAMWGPMTPAMLAAGGMAIMGGRKKLEDISK